MFAPKTKVLLAFIVTGLITMTLAGDSRKSCPGCPHDLSGDKLEQAKSHLTNSLEKLAAGEGPTYQLVEIKSASVQVVAGSLYKINAVLSDGDKTKICDIEIWEQPWLENGTQVTFDCPGEEKLVKKHG